MRNCYQCKSELPEGAQFCPDCGAKQSLLVNTCVHCNKLNEEEAAFCIHCGEVLKMNRENEGHSNRVHSIYSAKYPLDFGESVRLPVQFRTYFLKTLRERLEAEGNSDYFDDYVNTFYDSSFLKSFDNEAKDMAEQSYLLHSDQSPNAAREVDEYLSEKFETLLNRFLIIEAGDVHDSPLSEKVMQYQDRSIADQYLGDMILDYLNLEEEQEKWYSNTNDMPKLKLKNALDFFLFADAIEKVFLICDQTIFGSCREGFALTDKNLYWKAHFNKPQQLNYKEIKSIELSEEWLVINGKFFNANPAINVKMMHLLKKLSGRNL
jgi:hypothetical protein